MTYGIRYWIGCLILSIGISLFGVTSLGHWTDIGGYNSEPPRPWERFDKELVKRTPNFQSLLAEASRRANGQLNELPPDEAMEILYAVIVDRFTHGDAQHTIFTNWILWGLGKIHPALAHIWDADIAVSRGHSLFCDQSSYLLLCLALESDIRARHVGLDGHVVTEAWYNNDWHLYDPDLEVIPKDKKGDVVSVDELSQNAELLQKLYSGPRENAVPIFATRENNTFVSYPIGARFEWKCQVLSLLEKVMEVFKFGVPIVLVFWGILLMRGRRVNI